MAIKYTSTLNIYSENDLINLSSKISNYIQPNDVIGLNGDLGTGKTTFVRHFCQSLGSPDWVNSPTYTIMQSYKSGSLNIIHVDLYRCESEQSIDQLNLDSYINESSILIVEWLNKTKLILPTLSIHFSYLNSTSRSITIDSNKHRWVQSLNNTNTN